MINSIFEAILQVSWFFFFFFYLLKLFFFHVFLLSFMFAFQQHK